MSEFIEKFNKLINERKTVDNYDQFKRVDAVFKNTEHKKSIFKKRKHQLANFIKSSLLVKTNNIDEHLKFLELVFDKLETSESKELFIKLIAYRKLGYEKVQLPLCSEDYINGIKEIRKLADCSQSISPNFSSWKLCLFDLTSIGYNISLFFEPTSVYIEFVLQPYQFNKNGTKIKCENDVYVIDAGGCWGDTALSFALEAGEEGKVYSFEFIPGNVDIMKRNFSLNPELQKRIEIVENPVWSESDEIMYCNDFGPASTIKSTLSDTHNIKITTISIDDFVTRSNVKKIDFIKMDIEGAETSALKGAIETIKKFKPKLAICLYHSISDFYEIPLWIDKLNLGYKFYIDHFTHAEGETVLYAQAN
jgi:FkbM family methyltransferase